MSPRRVDGRVRRATVPARSENQRRHVHDRFCKTAPKKPARPYFSSGPCAKRGVGAGAFEPGLVGRSHRSKRRQSGARRPDPRRSRTCLSCRPTTGWRSFPGRIRCVRDGDMWSLIGPRGVDVFAWMSSGGCGCAMFLDELRLKDVAVHDAPFGSLPDLSRADFDRDVIFTANGTTSGVRVADFDWISDDRPGLTLCDATSAVFAQEMDWRKLDAVTFSWQKCLGGEAAHGVLILSPRAVERARTYSPVWPVPKLFRFARDGVLDEALFDGRRSTRRRCYASRTAGKPWRGRARWAVAKRCKCVLKRTPRLCYDWIEASGWAGSPVTDPVTRSVTSVVISIADPAYARLDEPAQRRFRDADGCTLGSRGRRLRHRGSPGGAARLAYLDRCHRGGRGFDGAPALARLAYRTVGAESFAVSSG